MPPSAESPYRLLVEGPNDKYSVIHLMIRHGFDWDDGRSTRPYVSPEGGVEKLLKAVTVALKGSYERLGIVLDTDANLSNRWAQLKAHAERAGVLLPETPQPEGTITSGRRPELRVGIWLMPDNASPGTLEDFLSRLVPQEDRSWRYADEVVIQARERGARCQEKDHVKSVLHTWLAWQEEPGLPFGTALKAEVFDKDSDEAGRFVAWFNRLFVVS